MKTNLNQTTTGGNMVTIIVNKDNKVTDVKHPTTYIDEHLFKGEELRCHYCGNTPIDALDDYNNVYGEDQNGVKFYKLDEYIIKGTDNDGLAFCCDSDGCLSSAAREADGEFEYEEFDVQIDNYVELYRKPEPQLHR